MIASARQSSLAGSSRRSRGSGTHTLGTLGQCPIDFLSRSRAAGACRRLKLYSPKVPGSLGPPVGSSVSGERSESGHQLLETPSAFGLFGVAAGTSDSSLGGSEAFASRPLPERQDQGDHAEGHAGAEPSPPKGWRLQLEQGNAEVEHEGTEHQQPTSD